MSEPTPPARGDQVSRVARAAHDFRAPLHTIVAVSSLLRHTALDDSQRKHLDALDSATALLIRLVDDLLEAPGGDRSGIPRIEVFSIRRLVEEVAELVAPRARAAGLSVVTVVSPETPAAVIGDGPRISQILTNLAFNAVKYTERGEVTLRARRDASTGLCRFEVEDTGVGILADQVALIFEPYTQLDPANRAGGVGLGLSICRDLARRIGGSLTVRSEVGQGSTFALEVALAAATDPGLSPALAFDVARLRFLFVGLTPASTENLKANLSIWNPSIFELTSLPEESAFDDFDVVVLDEDAVPASFLLPSTSGDGPARIVLCSPANGEAQRKPSTGARRATHLIKPARAVDLHRALAQVLKDRRQTLAFVHETAIPPDLAGLRVLVVDDSAPNLQYARLALQAAGATVETASTGDGVPTRVAAKNDWGIVLLDLEMPGASGIEVIKKIRAAERAEDARIPIVVLSAHTGAQIDDAYLAGATSHVTKPVHPQELVAAVATFARRDSTMGVEPATGAQTAVVHPAVVARVKEAQMALVRRDFRSLALVLNLIPDEAKRSPDALKEALERKDLRRLQQLLNAIAPSAAYPVGRDEPAELATNKKVAQMVTTGLRKDFVAATREYLDAARALIPPRGAADREQLRVLAHRLSGSAPLFGFVELGEHARRLDQAFGSEPSAPAVDELVEPFVRALERAAYG